MAAKGPLRVTVSFIPAISYKRATFLLTTECCVQNAPLGPSYDDEPFDVDVLCAKLEIAKREREEREAASALRRQVRQAVRNSQDESRRRSRPQLVIDPNKTHSRNSSYAEQTCSPRSIRSTDQPLSWADVTINIPEHRAIDAAALGPRAAGGGGYVHSTNVSRSALHEEATRNQSTPPQSTTKRNPFSLLKSLTGDDTELRTRRTLIKDRPEDVAKRRSQTSPLLQHRICNDPSTNPLIDSTRPSMTHGDDYQSMNYLSEYAVCFDTSPARENRNDWDFVQSPQSVKAPGSQLIDRPEWTSARGESLDGMRSFLNLSSMLKKDKKDKNVRASVVEVQAPPAATNDSEAVVPRSRPHTRSQTAPEDIICEAVERIEQDQRGKKRRSMGAFLQTILLPSQSHHTMSNASHCVAI